MTNTLIASALGVLLSFSTLASHAIFVGSDFDIVIQGFDSNPPFFDNQAGTAYDVWITNNSDQTAIFGENLFYPELAFISAQIDGVSVFDSDAYQGSFFSIKENFGDRVIAPGETYYMGGGVFLLDIDFLPAVSIVELTGFSLGFRNTSSLSEVPFRVDYNGDPIINTITTVPVPAVGLALVPMIVLMRLFGRRPWSL